MGWYQIAGRHAFFAIPPEPAHRLAGTLLNLPMPWEAVGGASTDPDLATRLAGLPLRNPLALAAGFDKGCAHLDVLGRLGFGYVVGGTITRAARVGNPGPRIRRYPGRRSMVNAMGLPNPGAERVAATLRRAPRGPAARVVSIADERIEDAGACVALLAPLVDAIELNASCPNVSWGRDRDNEAHLRKLLSAFHERTDRPLFVKLPHFVTATEQGVVLALARIAQEGGARGLTCSNTRPVGEPRLTAGTGGLSGRALWPRTAEIVATVAKATGGELPINASGGVFTAEDALACLDAGAATVQIYTALIYEGPGVVGRITRGLAERLRRRGSGDEAFARKASAPEPAD